MKCCGKEMYDNGDNYHCSDCNKRIYKKDLKICPICRKEVFLTEIMFIVLIVEIANFYSLQ